MEPTKSLNLANHMTKNSPVRFKKAEGHVEVKMTTKKAKFKPDEDDKDLEVS